MSTVKENSMDKEWDLVIKPKSSLFDIDVKEVLKYKDLLMMFVKRDFISVYKQTILGPIWFFIQPIFTTITFTIVFGTIAKISTESIPAPLFYLAGITLWNYFSECLNKTSDVFTTNASIFGKVYFPRLVVPISIIVSNLLKLAVQFALFLGLWFYYLASDVYAIHPQYGYMILLPFLILIMALIGLGSGIILSALTTKYRDLKFLISFGVQLLMYATPIVYPLSSATGKIKMILLLNPITSVIELFKFMFLGVGSFNPMYLIYATVFSILVFVLGVLIFNKVEKNFMDVV
ncbi:MAG: ABC transporter permease [Bacteroidetes bacterium]|nr:ABC transporter permease [Bacteroidota bacterium]